VKLRLRAEGEGGERLMASGIQLKMGLFEIILMKSNRFEVGERGGGRGELLFADLMESIFFTSAFLLHSFFSIKPKQ
jgi:hypothetical protein